MRQPDPMAAKTISSVFSLVLKVLLPALWICAFGATTVLLWLKLMHGREGGPPDEAMIFLILWTAGSVSSFLLIPMRLKRMRIGQNGLYISNYLQEISVPFESIKDVTFSRWIPGPITVHFRDDTAFGDRIVFLPVDFNFRNWNRPHPVIAELRRLAGLKG